MNSEKARQTRAPGSGDRGGVVARAVRRLLAMPLFYKILVANGAIVAAVAVSVALLAGWATPGVLAVGAAVVGVLLTVALNAVIVRLALRPLDELQQTAERIRSGDAAARVPASALSDRDLMRLAATFNDMLDADAEHRRRLRQIAVAALGAAEEERKRIARDLHDGIAQALAALRIRVRVARKTRDDAERDALLEGLSEDLGAQIDELRALAAGLRPPALDMLGLAAAVETLARQLGERTGARIHTDAEPMVGKLDATTELAVYRIVQEAMTNAAKHAEANRIQVALGRQNGRVVASVRDDGRGFAVDEAMRGGAIGLFGMQERAAYVGGDVRIESVPGRGTRVDITIPVAEVN